MIFRGSELEPMGGRIIFGYLKIASLPIDSFKKTFQICHSCMWAMEFFFCYVVGGKNWNPENDDENESDTGNTGMYQGK